MVSHIFTKSAGIYISILNDLTRYECDSVNADVFIVIYHHHHHHLLHNSNQYNATLQEI